MSSNSEAILFEHLFWLQVLGDHARFIFSNLSPKEEDEIRIANGFLLKFDQLLNEAHEVVKPRDLMDLTNAAFETAKKLREFKLHLLSRHLTQIFDFHLPPTFINHMVNELEEYLQILEYYFCKKMVPCMHPLHHELLWVKDAQGHANALTSGFDDTETELKKKSNEFMKEFRNLYDKAVELHGYLRTELTEFPALCRYNFEVQEKIDLFREFLCYLREIYTSREGLGSIVPLIPDHMLREECYFLIKLSEVSNITEPDCDPTRPRFEG